MPRLLYLVTYLLFWACFVAGCQFFQDESQELANVLSIKPDQPLLPSMLDQWAMVPTNWQPVENIVPSPVWNIETQEGEVWLGQRGDALCTSWSHGDLLLAFEFMLSSGARADVRLMDDYTLKLHAADSLGGGVHIEGEKPKGSYDYLPGLWQKIEIIFRAPSADSSARYGVVNSVLLNGSLLYENVRLEGDGATTGPLCWQVQAGQIAVRGVKYLKQDKDQSEVPLRIVSPLELKDLTYAYYALDQKPKEFPDFTAIVPTRSGNANLITPNAHSSQEDNYAVLYKGTLVVETSGEYIFQVASDDGAKIRLDGEEMMHVKSNQEELHAASLEAGMHDFELAYYNGAGKAYLHFNYFGAGLPYGTFSDYQQLKETETPGADMTVRLVGEEVQAIRSFLAFPPHQSSHDPKQLPARIAHGISVGREGGPHYAVNLSTGSLLYFWRGPFGNASEMWERQGITQVFEPASFVVVRSGKPDYIHQAAEGSMWPDTLPHQAVVRLKEYRLDSAGYPIFIYETGGGEISDHLYPTENHLERVIEFKNLTGSIAHLVAEGSQVQQLDENRYAVQVKGYFVQIVAQEGVQLNLLSPSEDLEVLSAQSIQPSGSLTLRYIW